jgi:hypothetical protein
MSRMEADEFLRTLGAEVRMTAGGYTRYKFPDSSEVWICPNGEVVRIPQRAYDRQGQRTNRGGNGGRCRVIQVIENLATCSV